MQDKGGLIPCVAVPAAAFSKKSEDPSPSVAAEIVTVRAEATTAAPDEPARVRVNTSALTGVRCMAFLNIATGHFVSTLEKPFHVDLMGVLIIHFLCE